MKHIKKFNEGFLSPKKKNIDIIGAVKNAGLSIRKVDDEVYRTNPKNGYEFAISSGSDAFSVKISYYGTRYKDELVRTDLSEYLFDVINGEKPGIIHKYNSHLYAQNGKRGWL